MSLGGGIHWKGPLLGSDEAGPFEDIATSVWSDNSSRFKTYVEDFDSVMADGELAARGVTVSDINTATSPTEVVTKETGYLLINPGTKADSGTHTQAVAAASSTIHPEFQTIGPIVSTATLMDSREMAFETRIGVQSDTTVWDGKVILGWLASDASPMGTDGIPSLTTGGGIGFHFHSDGVLRYFARQTALTAVAHMTDTVIDITTLTTAAVFQWYKLGFRAKWADASAGTGAVSFFVNDRKVGEITTDLPMASTQTYGVAFGVLNGAARVSDLAVDYVITAITGPGR